MPNFAATRARLDGPGRPASTPADLAVAAAESRMGVVAVDRNDGRLAIEHQEFFGSIWNAGIGSYYTRFDEALKAGYEDAIAMWNDPAIYELVRHRQYPVLNVNHYLRPDNPRDKGQQALCTELMRILDASFEMQDLRLANLEAIFWGKAGAQFATGRKMINGSLRVVVADHEPIHGDKIVHRHDGTPGVMIHATAEAKVAARGGRTFRSDRALCLALDTPYWRDRFTLHQHEPSDAEYLFEADKAATKFGRGVRDRIYWAWWLRQEVLGWFMNSLKRIGANGNFIGFYDAGNPTSEDAVLRAIKTYSEHGATAFPRSATGQGPAFDHIPPSPIAYEVMLRAADYYDSIIRRAIVGQEMTGEAASTGMNSNQAEVHADVLKGINAYDAKKLAGCLTRDLVRVLIRENYGSIPFGVRLVFEPEQDEFQVKVASAKALVDLGATLDLTDLVEEAGFKMAKAGTVGATIPTGPPDGGPAGPKPAGAAEPTDGPKPERNAAAASPRRYAADRSAIVVALIPRDVADRIAIPGQEDPAGFHITLGYLGRDLDPGRRVALDAVVREVATAAAPLTGTLGGTGQFPPSASSDGKDVLWKPVDVPGLAELRQDLVARLAAAGFAASDEHGWTPHVTLAYTDPGRPFRTLAGGTVPLTISALGVWVGDEHTAVPLGTAAAADAGPERYARKGERRAPEGGATINGRDYKAGEWIPAHAMKLADDALKARIRARGRTRPAAAAASRATPATVAAAAAPEPEHEATSQASPHPAPAPPAAPPTAATGKVRDHVGALLRAQFQAADLAEARVALDGLADLPDAKLARVARKFLGATPAGDRDQILAAISGRIAQTHYARHFAAEQAATKARRRARAAARVARDAPAGASTPGPGVDAYAKAGAGPERYAAHHAPEGGVTIGDTFYDGGRFIPRDDVARADPATRDAILGGPGKTGNHHLDGMIGRARAGHYAYEPGASAAFPEGGHREIAHDVAEFLAAHDRTDRQRADLPGLLHSAGVAMPLDAGRKEIRRALVDHLTILSHRSGSLTDAEREAIPEATAAEDHPGSIQNAYERAEAGVLHPDDIGPIVDEALATPDGRHDLGEFAAEMRIAPGMGPDRLRWRAVLALSQLNRENGGRAAPEVRREARERKQARRERADAYRAGEPGAIARAAAGVPATRAEFRAAHDAREADPAVRRRVARSGRSGLAVDDPRHPDPEAAVLRHHLTSYQRRTSRS